MLFTDNIARYETDEERVALFIHLRKHYSIQCFITFQYLWLFLHTQASESTLYCKGTFNKDCCHLDEQTFECRYEVSELLFVFLMCYFRVISICILNSYTNILYKCLRIACSQKSRI